MDGRTALVAALSHHRPNEAMPSPKGESKDTKAKKRYRRDFNGHVDSIPSAYWWTNSQTGESFTASALIPNGTHALNVRFKKYTLAGEERPGTSFVTRVTEVESSLVGTDKYYPIFQLAESTETYQPINGNPKINRNNKMNSHGQTASVEDIRNWAIGAKELASQIPLQHMQVTASLI
ncbi:MAG: hypothetical protein A2776_01980 [Candidatus Levybacteria bacterium RIFCSPHIGHO2_01_FULL_40_10]|nr:MAG: hypothetical protein A2776_01980 [Candidatus Levybacteria bacterium RIFCSPHIGHO2_01_FULL_40_10]